MLKAPSAAHPHTFISVYLIRAENPFLHFLPCVSSKYPQSTPGPNCPIVKTQPFQSSPRDKKLGQNICIDVHCFTLHLSPDWRAKRKVMSWHRRQSRDTCKWICNEYMCRVLMNLELNFGLLKENHRCSGIWTINAVWLLKNRPPLSDFMLFQRRWFRCIAIFFDFPRVEVVMCSCVIVSSTSAVTRLSHYTEPQHNKLNS